MDRALVEAARSGDEEAFASIARGSADRLFGIAHRILRDVGRAEDAVQQTLVTAWKELPGLRESERFDAWIHRILVHACYAEAKKASQWSANVVALTIEGPATPDSRSGRRDARRPRARVPTAAAGATRRLRPPSLPRLVARRDRRDARRADWARSSRGSATPPQRFGPAWRPTPGRTTSASRERTGMTDNEFERTARAWLDDGPNQISDRALQSALDQIHVTRQRRAWWPARRFSSMGNPLPHAVAGLAAVVLASVIGLSLLPGGGFGGGLGAHRRPRLPLHCPRRSRPR